MDDDDLFLQPGDAPHDSLADPLRSQVGEEFWELIIWQAGNGILIDDGIFDQNGSLLLMRGEY